MAATPPTTKSNAPILAQRWQSSSGILRVSTCGGAPPLATTTMAALALAQSSQGPGQLHILAWLQNSATENEAARTARPSPVPKRGRRERDQSSAPGPLCIKKPRGGKAATSSQQHHINLFDDDDFPPTERQQQRPSRTSNGGGRQAATRGGRTNDELFAKSELNLHRGCDS